ncbi:STAS domain-containing protein [Crenothrix polyspora]|jgi:anti-sigma B factor antagonist|uniref:Anti-sigma factor antagonist n=1 Tax=Crenothrix polyspora TaxID=360316 RepID=A0A1R4H8D6_9GAMM|nr:STAS domain-containing protein [Crenothrix polyspora]SJM92446.1 Anti-sigma factor antagonist [Crenothrix polyspora]
MKIQIKTINGILFLVLEENRLDCRLAIDFKDKVSELVAEGSRLIILDLSAVDFIDSSGIGCLVTSLKLLGPQGRIVIWGLKAPVESMFKLTRMDRVFKLCSSEEQALQAVLN